MTLTMVLGLSVVSLNLHVSHPWSHDGFSVFDVAVDARHAAETAHWEPSTIAHQPVCVFCLLQRSSSRLPAPWMALGPDPAVDPMSAAAPDAPLAGFVLPGRSRGPPLS